MSQHEGMVGCMTRTTRTGGGVGTNQHAVKGVSRISPPRACRPRHAVVNEVKAAAAADLDHITFDEDDLRGVNLSGRNLYGAQFTFCDADSADLRGSDARNAVFFNTTFRDADMRGVDLRGAHFIDCDLDGAILDGARYSDTTRIELGDRSRASAGMVPYLDSRN